jgi:hypothetical protein
MGVSPPPYRFLFFINGVWVILTWIECIFLKHLIISWGKAPSDWVHSTQNTELKALAFCFCFFKRDNMLGTYNPGYLGVWDQEDFSSRPGQTNSSLNSISKISRAKWTDWRCGSNNRMPALQAWSPQFKPHSHQK